MLPAFASVDDLKARVPGGIEDDDQTRAQAVLNGASSLIRAEAGQSWVDEDGALALPSGEDAWKADALVFVCLGAALRSFLNPQNLTGESEAVDGYNHAEQFAIASPDVYLTKSERNIVNRVAGKLGLGAFSVDTVGCSVDVHADVCALRFGAVYCSCGADLTCGVPLYEVFGL